ncbi:MAG: carbohydrate kinase family protein [Candidatus Norongarragalinales archaeon]
MQLNLRENFRRSLSVYSHSAPHDVAVAGDLCVDLVFPKSHRLPKPGGELSTTSAEKRVGGSSGITAMQLATLGNNVVLIGNIGEDQEGRWLKSNFESAGVDTSKINQHPGVDTGKSFVVPLKNDRSFITVIGANARPIRLASLKAHALIVTAFFQAPGLHAGAFAKDLERFKSAGGIVALDCNHDSSGVWFKKIKPVLAATDVFYPNQKEFDKLMRTSDSSPWNWGPKTIVVKEQQNGATLFDLSAPKKRRLPLGVIPYLALRAMRKPAVLGSQKTKVYGVPVGRFVDSNGAGDVWGATYVDALLKTGDKHFAVLAANVAGAISTTRTRKVVTREEIIQKIAELMST